MRILSLDTTTRQGSAAIVEDDRVVDVRQGDASRSHAERLPGELIALVGAHDLTFADIDLFAVAAGPGSFTGLRIGIATIQGLAFTCGRRVVAVSALDAIAHTASAVEPGTSVVAWMDAHRREVFSRAYRVTAAPAFDAGRLAPATEPAVGTPAAILEELTAARGGAAVTFAGDGAALYRDDIVRLSPTARFAVDAPIAGTIGLMAIALARQDQTIDPAAIQPLYVRRPDAVIAREAGR
jgi:tRNA threonylcarbamoyladenosine biosynthesis protein TsaB